MTTKTVRSVWYAPYYLCDMPVFIIYLMWYDDIFKYRWSLVLNAEYQLIELKLNNSFIYNSSAKYLSF